MYDNIQTVSGAVPGYLQRVPRPSGGSRIGLTCVPDVCKMNIVVGGTRGQSTAPRYSDSVKGLTVMVSNPVGDLSKNHPQLPHPI